jgi:uncharacterized membrane protein YeaQ/YmgE (transglycosylase-associated protein family)
MDITGLLIFLAIGAVGGWLAGKIVKVGGFGFLGTIIIGIIGAVIGGSLLGLLGITAGGLIGSIVTATVGAMVLLSLVGLIKKSGHDHRLGHSNQQVSDRGMRNQSRLNKKIDDLQRQWELLSEILSRLNEQWILETRFEEKLRLRKL